MTPTRLRLLRYLVQYEQANDYAPTIDEMAAAMGGRSCGTIYEHLQSLAGDGYVCYLERNRARRWVVTEEGVTRVSGGRRGIPPTDVALALRIRRAIVDACPQERSILLGAAEILGLEVAA